MSLLTFAGIKKLYTAGGFLCPAMYWGGFGRWNPARAIQWNPARAIKWNPARAIKHVAKVATNNVSAGFGGISRQATRFGQPIRGRINNLVDSRGFRRIGGRIVNVGTLGHGKQVTHLGQTVARNPYVQGVALGVATVYTGGAAAAAMGGGAMAAAGGAVIANAAAGKVSGSSFGLKKAGIAGITAGLPVAGYKGAADVLQNAQNIKSAKDAYEAYKLSKQQGREADAQRAELSALMAQLQALKAQGASPQKQAALAQAIMQKTEAAKAPQQNHSLTLVAGGLMALKVLTFL